MELPEIDFTRDQVAAVFLGSRPSGGYTVRFAKGDEESGLLRLWCQEATPGGLPGPAVMTSASAIVSIGRSSKPILFDGDCR